MVAERHAQQLLPARALADGRAGAGADARQRARGGDARHFLEGRVDDEQEAEQRGHRVAGQAEDRCLADAADDQGAPRTQLQFPGVGFGGQCHALVVHGL